MVVKIGNKGASGYIAENTLASIKKSLDLNVEAIQIDIQTSKERIPIIFRSKRINGYPVNKIPLKILKRYDVGKGEQIPTLKEVLDYASYSVQYILSINNKSSVRPVLRLIKKYTSKYGWPSDRFIIESKSLSIIKLVRRLNKKIYVSYKSFIPFVKFNLAKNKKYDIDIFGIHRQFVTKSFIKRAHYRGFAVFVSKTNSKSEIELLKKWGVDGIASDYPDII